ncbi:hypothetical protein CL633_01595 [bacterium]|nr:hypothetical protein [bacterium]|tara:strand:+ start:11278 stop:12144 length:867 start_codon:yes stop_codon:yes gene_type:complete
MKILIIFLAGLGNAILFEPCLRAISNFFPDCKIDLYIKQKVVEALYKNSGLVNNFIYYDKVPFQSYDVVISTSAKLDWKEKLFLFLVRSKKVITQEKIGYSEDIHEIDCRLRLAHALGADVQDKYPKIFIPENTKNLLPNTSRFTVGFHPGCSEALKFKRWPAQRFTKVADSLDARIVFFGGPDEIKLSEKVIRMMKNKAINLTGKTNIQETALAVGNCDLFITNDSGLMHVASAMQVPLIAIFGPTSPVKNAPLSDHVILQKGKDVKNISTKNVINAAKKLCVKKYF